MLRIIASIGAGVLLVAAVGCPTRTVIVDGERRSQEAAAAPVFEHAKVAYEEGRLDEAIELLLDYVTRFPTGRDAPEALWLLASAYETAGLPSEARQTLEVLVARHPTSRRAREAREDLAALMIDAGDHAQAIALLVPALEASRGARRAAVAAVLLDAYMALEDWTNAVRLTSEIVRLTDDRDLRESALALQKTLIREQLTPGGIKQLHDELPGGSSAMPLLVEAMARAHHEAGEHEPATEALRSYLSRWPSGPFAEEARSMLELIRRLADVRPKVVGVILPLSGRFQHFGEAVLRGLGMALDTAEGRGVRVLIRDSEGDPEIATAAVEELVLEEKAIAIIGPLLTNTSFAAAAKANEFGVPMISLSRGEGLPEVGPWIFRNALSDAVQARALVDYAVETLGARSFGIMYPDHTYGVGLMTRFWDELDERKLEVRGVERYDPEETTFQPIVRKLVGRYHLQYRHDYMQEVRRVRTEVTDPLRRRRALSRALDEAQPIVDFDVLFIPDSYRTVGLIAPALAVEDVITNVCDTGDLRRIKDTTGRDRLAKVQLLGPNAWNHQELVTRGGRHVRCSVFVDGFFADSTRGETASFVERYRQMHGAGSSPDYLEAYGFDTAAIVGHVIEEFRPRHRVAFKEALIGIERFPGATGDTRFGSDGETRKRPFVLTVEGDRIVEIDEHGEPVQSSVQAAAE